MEVREAMARLFALANPEDAAGMARFGIPGKALGIRIPALAALAREAGKDHALALALWKTGVHEARILAALVDEPAKVTRAQMEAWARGFNSWDLCDQCVNKLFDRTPWAWDLADKWSRRKEEFVKRAGFVMMATLAVHDKASPDKDFVKFFPLIEGASDDPRNFVKKAVNWALRQIGKRNPALNREAVKTARRIHKRNTAPARWIANNALKELTDEKILARLRARPVPRKNGRQRY